MDSAVTSMATRRIDLYNEDQYIQEEFRKNFIENFDGNIVIYGTGMHTKKLLENEADAKIAGLMDASKTGEVIYGKKVLSYDEVAQIAETEPTYIVIIARNAVINVIYRRIQEFVSLYEIPVYTVNGKQLTASSADNPSKECFQQKEAELQALIDEAEVVSFDIFDTLLCRCVMRPADIFVHMDHQLGRERYIFSKERTKAESELTQNSNYNIYDIYEKFKENTGESDEKVNSLLQLEIDTEKKFIRRRERMCEILRQTADKGKKVYLISDMYFSADILKEILSGIDITEYDGLYVSTDWKSSKTENLFAAVRQDAELFDKKWLHIGDNFFSDICAPQRIGIKTFQVYSTTEMLEQSIYSNILEYNRSIEENIVIAYFASIAFNNPFSGFSENGRLQINEAQVMTLLIIAPVLMKYVIWLVKGVRQNNSDLIIFPSRDGFIIKHIYDELCSEYPEWKLPESIYLYTSRRAALIAAAENERDIDRIIKLPASGSFSERIKKRFDIGLSNEYEEIPQSLKAELLRICSREREAYKNYLKGVDFFEREKIAFIDFVAMGTVQDALQRITDKEIYGYYFLRRSPDSLYTVNLKCESMYPVSGDFQTEANIYKFYYFLENILSSYEPTFKRIEPDGTKEFYEELRSKAEIEQLRDIHQAVITYCKDMFALFPDILSMDADIKLYDKLLGFFDRDYTDINPDILNNIINYDELLGKKVTELNR